MSIDKVLNNLSKTRKAGANKWRAPCPVHNGKDYNLMVSEREDGSIGVYCFVCGAKEHDLADALMLDRKMFYKPLDGYERLPVVTKKMESEEKADRLVLMMAENATSMTLADRRRVQLAKARLEGIAALRGESV